MFVMLQGENYTANLYLFLAIYNLYDKENSEKFESQFLKFSQTVGSTFNMGPLTGGPGVTCRFEEMSHFTVANFPPVSHVKSKK